MLSERDTGAAPDHAMVWFDLREDPTVLWFVTRFRELLRVSVTSLLPDADALAVTRAQPPAKLRAMRVGRPGQLQDLIEEWKQRQSGSAGAP